MKCAEALLAALLPVSLAALHAADAPDGMLSSGEYSIRQSWSQEQDFPRPYHVNVPANPDNRKLPVLIFLHGNGGNAKDAMSGFLRQRRTIAARYVTVFPDGYRESWNISGTEDRLNPYHGGPSPAIPAKNGKLGFVAAEKSIFLWAKAMGYQGEKLEKPSKTVGKLEVLSYLDGAVIHYKALGEGHGAAAAIDEATLLRLLENKQ